jgi:hypothetical protein
MNTKVKLFTADSPEDLEGVINLWLDTNHYDDPKFEYNVSPYIYASNNPDSIMASRPKQMYSCMIVYKG